jgi:thiol-disulfide isomerase/thioredoxin
MHKIIFIICLFTLFSCKNKANQKLQKGTYRAVLTVQDHKELPFIFEVINEKSIVIFNGEEIIKVEEISYKNDSIIIQTPVFEGYIIAKIEDNKLMGTFVKPSLNRTVPFYAEKNLERFSMKSKSAKVNISGNWETVFSQYSEKNKYFAKGIFKQVGNKVTGTFRTTTGDYRYLEGIVDGDSLKLSTFDGAHAFLFTAKITDTTMNGFFYSGNHWKEPFTAKLDTTYELPNEDNLTYLKKGFDYLEFSFPDESGSLVSLEDEQFKNKVVLVQIMGTWCPNCLDESKYFASYLKENPNKEIAVVALAFELAKTKNIAFKNIKRLRDKIGITYPILLAQYGKRANKKLAQEKLPMLNHILSYPTTIFIDKKGAVRKIHTGFNGPATGKKYLKFKKEFTEFMDLLIHEK